MDGLTAPPSAQATNLDDVDGAAINGSGVEQVVVVFAHNVLGYQRGQTAILPVDTPELADCMRRGFVHLVDENGDEIVPDGETLVGPAPCASCGGG